MFTPLLYYVYHSFYVSTYHLQNFQPNSFLSSLNLCILPRFCVSLFRDTLFRCVRPTSQFSCLSFLVGLQPESIQSMDPLLSFKIGVGQSISGSPSCFIRCRRYWIPLMPLSTAFNSAIQELLLPLFSLWTPHRRGPPILVR